jgi:hypothetical protein
MTLWVHAFCAYPSYMREAEGGPKWRNADYHANLFIRKIKGEQVKGDRFAQIYSSDRIARRVDNSAHGEENALKIFGIWGAHVVRGQGLSRASFVPIPSSSCLAIGADAKGRRMAQSIAAEIGGSGFEVFEALHWMQALPKSSQGGTRSVHVLRENLRAVDRVSPRDIILVDDVATTHAHIKACAAVLRHRGHRVEHAICAAQTIKTPQDDMFKIAPVDADLSAAAAEFFPDF